MSINIDKKTKNEVNTASCKHFVLRKKRFCRMTVKFGYDYCGEHEPTAQTEKNYVEDVDGSRLRVTCPLDSKHTCFADKLAKHLKKCNAQKTVPASYIVSDINTGENYKDFLNNARQLSSVSTNIIMDIIGRVNIVFEGIEKTISKKILHHEILTDELNKPEYGSTAKKHLLQTSSIIAQLNEANLIQAKTCFVEFGAGKGQLSYWLSQVINSVPDSSILLVERASLRHKLDNKLDKEKNNLHRVRADIADLVLNKVEIVQQSGNVVGITKHLCGEATDLALRCLINGKNQGANIHGLVMAFCCHHRCQWGNYVGQQFFKNKKFSNVDFDIICGLVSWATCGSGLSREARKNIENKTNENNQVKNREEELCLTREERENIGKKCKLLIDYGRFDYLLNNNFLCNLYYYVEQDITLENVCIVAQRK